MNEIHGLRSNQEETDTGMILYLHHAAALGFKSAVVRTPDTDILVILLHHSHSIKLTIFLDIGSGKNCRIVNIKELSESLGKDYCSTLMGYFVFSGTSTVQVLSRERARWPLKKLQKNPKFQESLR